MRGRGKGQRVLDRESNGTALTDDSYDAQLPDDLDDIARSLRANRTTADGEMLERVRERARANARLRQRRRFLTPYTGTIVAIAAGLAVTAKLAHVAVASDLATLADSVTSPVSSTTDGSAADAVYCGQGSGSGLSGWAPTFRWHYGFPTPDTQGADDGWSASVQPSCPDGSLSIRWSDDGVSVVPGNQLDFGYDFHQANKPPFTMTAYNLQVNWTYTCSSKGPTMTYAPTNEMWSQNTYTATDSSPYWIPTGTKDDPLGFQGTMTVPALCGAGNPVTFTGGTFSAVIQIT